MRTRLTPVGALLGAVLLAVLTTATALAYAGEVAATVEVSGASGPQACDTPITITARVEDINGDPIDGQPVTWSFASGNVAGDTILDTETTTDVNGIATTQVQFACSPHSVTVEAQADDATGSGVLSSTGDGLPRTDTAPGSTAPSMGLALIAVLLGGAMILRRFAAARR